MLVALSLLWFLGVRYPLQLLPALLFELAWKIIWTIVVVVPLWRSDQLDPATLYVFYTCLVVVIPAAVIPWRYVFTHYVTKPGDRWRSTPPGHDHRRVSHQDLRCLHRGRRRQLHRPAGTGDRFPRTQRCRQVDHPADHRRLDQSLVGDRDHLRPQLRGPAEPRLGGRGAAGCVRAARRAAPDGRS